MHADPFHPSAPRSSGDPDHDELFAFLQEKAAQPAKECAIKPLSWPARLAVALAAIAIVLFIAATFLEGLARADARPAGCNGLTESACQALMSEGGAQ
ncbi:hypothetical protein [Paracoccus hibiscisoli]|uniref:Uncharacterized protein n=1 Tax=Paracoccus hibiscisoli TaxID=2023261 RepID=A0A4U0QUP0_9RHOB|nr:hypothetical protein [Paracoccus hibiscisoli]TJZ85805.1 hypothetical protein FA740_05240 [Paracoccus hibiscisoli]